MFKRFLLVATLPAFLAGALCAQTESDAYRQSLRHDGYVNDFANVIPANDERRLEMLLRELERKTSVELAVVAVDSMRGGEVNDFANRLFEQWGIGKKDKDNGILLFAAIRDRKARIEVGYGMEGLIPDARAGRILDDSVLPWFRRDQYRAGLLNGALDIARRVAADAGVNLGENVAPRAPPGPARGDRGLSWYHILFFLLLIPVIIRHPWILLLLLSGGRGGGFSGGGFGGGSGGFGGGLSGGGGASRGW